MTYPIFTEVRLEIGRICAFPIDERWERPQKTWQKYVVTLARKQEARTMIPREKMITLEDQF
jgi:hypothetical protein